MERILRQIGAKQTAKRTVQRTV